MALDSGARLGPYEILEPLGTGGMGEVYRARDWRLGRIVAIKVLRHDLVADPDRIERFEREARSASALNHPNIVTIHDVGVDGSTSYIAMEFSSLLRTRPSRCRRAPSTPRSSEYGMPSGSRATVGLAPGFSGESCVVPVINRQSSGYLI
jgi:hypothetical protein